MVDGGGDKVGGFEYFEVALCAPTAAGAIDDGAGVWVPVDFLEGEGRAQEVLGEALAAFCVAGGDGFLAAVDMEAAVLPGEKSGGFVGAEEFGVAEDLEEAMPEEFDDGAEAFFRHGVEAAFLVEQAIGGENVEVRVEDEVIAEGVDGGPGGDAAIGQAEADAEGVAQAFGGGLEEEVEKLAALAEDAAKHFREGEDELAVWNVAADGGGDPCAGLAGAALVAGGAEVAGLAGEGEEFLVPAGRAMEAGEAGGEVATAHEGADGGDGIRAQRSHEGAVAFFVAGEEIIPRLADDLPERRCAGTPGMVDGGHG